MTEFGKGSTLLFLHLPVLVEKAVEIPYGKLPSSAKPEIGLNGGEAVAGHLNGSQGKTH